VIVADTSIWIDHLRTANPVLTGLIVQERLFVHPFVIAELALGHVPRRGRFFDFLAGLPLIGKVSDDHQLSFVEEHTLFGTGLGFVDSHLLASVATHPEARLWSRDKRLHAHAERLELAYPPA
jgi:predicted nucleic acid-binding protein